MFSSKDNNLFYIVYKKGSLSMPCSLLKTSILDFLHPALTMSLWFFCKIIEWNGPFCMQWFHNDYPCININFMTFLSSFICFSIWREYQNCGSLHKKDLQLLLADKWSSWKMLVICFGMAHILLVDCFAFVIKALVQWPLNTSAISSHC